MAGASRRRANWFATLRRDGLAFAVLVALLAVSRAIQPLAAAEAAVLCTPASVEQPYESQFPSPDHDCALCLTGVCWAFSVQSKGLPASVIPIAPAREMRAAFESQGESLPAVPERIRPQSARAPPANLT